MRQDIDRKSAGHFKASRPGLKVINVVAHAGARRGRKAKFNDKAPPTQAYPAAAGANIALDTVPELVIAVSVPVAQSPAMQPPLGVVADAALHQAQAGIAAINKVRILEERAKKNKEKANLKKLAKAELLVLFCSRSF